MQAAVQKLLYRKSGKCVELPAKHVDFSSLSKFSCSINRINQVDFSVSQMYDLAVRLVFI